MAKRLLPLLSLGVFFLALRHLVALVSRLQFAEIAASAQALPRSSVAACLGCTVLSYVFLCLPDLIALGKVSGRVPWRYAAGVSFATNVFSNNVGYAVFSAAPLRYRLYGRCGLSFGDISRIILFCLVTFWVGFSSLGSVLFLAFPLSPGDLGPWSTKVLGWICAAVTAAYLGFSLCGPAQVRVCGRTLEKPPLGLVCLQIATSVLDWFFAAGALWVLLSSQVPLRFCEFFTAFLLAQVVGVGSQVPGGLGVFESVLLSLLGPQASQGGSLLGLFLVFRVCYYLLPLTLGAAAFAVLEWAPKLLGAGAREPAGNPELC